MLGRTSFYSSIFHSTYRAYAIVESIPSILRIEEHSYFESGVKSVDMFYLNCEDTDSEKISRIIRDIFPQERDRLLIEGLINTADLVQMELLHTFQRKITFIEKPLKWSVNFPDTKIIRHESVFDSLARLEPLFLDSDQFTYLSLFFEKLDRSDIPQCQGLIKIPPKNSVNYDFIKSEFMRSLFFPKE